MSGLDPLAFLSHTVAMDIASNEAIENNITVRLNGCRPLFPTITMMAPSRPSSNPSHLLFETVSFEIDGTIKATSIGCIEVINATVAAEPPRENAIHAVPKYTT